MAAALVSCSAAAAELNRTETRWLQGMWPVVMFARQSRMPLDIVVQPQSAPGAAPLALGFVDGRCKLVLSMRGNAQAQATLERIEPELLDAALELMAAHELGHCRRYLDGAWYGLPAGFTVNEPVGLEPDLRTAYAGMQATRREEAYGDLVGLAWTQQQRPALYARVHAWLLEERSRDLIPGSHHDTLAWLRLAERGFVQGNPRASVYAAAADLWASGLSAADD